ncbi:hypothetical protein [Serinicoccus marinus]|uniref:hypothetical protein n=1 Tax=Serinicoccus marinus TaxID=247333 RepID=UPI001EE8C93A|nr:hypothetical protein [Serinicoccus marinus]
MAPATEVGRAVPVVGVATRSWSTPLRPALPGAVAVFERTGGVLPVEDDEQFDAIFTALGTVAPLFDYLAAIEGFLRDHGLPAGGARTLLGRTSRSRSARSASSRSRTSPSCGASTPRPGAATSRWRRSWRRPGCRRRRARPWTRSCVARPAAPGSSRATRLPPGWAGQPALGSSVIAMLLMQKRWSVGVS